MNKLSIKSAVVAVILLLSSILAFAAGDGITVRGVVTDSKKEAVPGAVVMLKGNTSVHAITDAEGRYSIQVPSEGAVLEFSCLNFKSVSEQVSGRAVIDIVLEEDALQLDEIVVVGYGAMRRSDLTGSVASLKVDEADASRSTSIDQLLAGRVSGVQVLNNGASPDGGVSIRIRGLSSFNGSTEPLYVLDGIIINPAAYTHTSVALLDAVKAVGIPTVEVHVSDPDSREEFRHVSYIRAACVATIRGHGLPGYVEALRLLAEKLG